MKQTTTCFLTATALAASFFCSTANAQFQLIGERSIKVSESLWLQLTDEPGHLMSDGYRHFLAGNTAEAGHSIRKAAVFLKIYASNAKGYIQEDLSGVARDLDTVAKGVEDGTITRGSVLENAFCRAEHALAEFQYGYARESWTQKEARLAGYRMRAAGNALERAARWSGEELEAGASKTVETTRRVGAAMANGGEVVADEFGRGMDALGKGISGFGRRFEKSPAGK